MVRRSREEWRRICAASHASGLTVAEFAERAGVNARTLSWWRWHLREQISAPEQGAFVEVVELGAPARSHGGVQGVSVRIGAVVVELAELPPVEWLVELSARC